MDSGGQRPEDGRCPANTLGSCSAQGDAMGPEGARTPENSGSVWGSLSTSEEKET